MIVRASVQLRNNRLDTTRTGYLVLKCACYQPSNPTLPKANIPLCNCFKNRLFPKKQKGKKNIFRNVFEMRGIIAQLDHEILSRVLMVKRLKEML